MRAASHTTNRERERLRHLAAEIRAGIEKERYACARTREWAQLLPEHRMAFLLLAGLDGDLGALARKAWAEFTPDEKIALQVALRGLGDSLARCVALTVRAG